MPTKLLTFLPPATPVIVQADPPVELLAVLPKGLPAVESDESPTVLVKTPAVVWEQTPVVAPKLYVAPNLSSKQDRN
jgi:hypothetical protein